MEQHVVLIRHAVMGINPILNVDRQNPHLHLRAIPLARRQHHLLILAIKSVVLLDIGIVAR